MDGARAARPAAPALGWLEERHVEDARKLLGTAGTWARAARLVCKEADRRPRPPSRTDRGQDALRNGPTLEWGRTHGPAVSPDFTSQLTRRARSAAGQRSTFPACPS